MKIVTTAIPDLLIIEPEVFGDDRDKRGRYPYLGSPPKEYGSNLEKKNRNHWYDRHPGEPCDQSS